jgi:hypothetical protein
VAARQQVSPSLSFYALELGLMALLLSVLFRWQQRQTPNRSGLLLVLGQTAFFFYLLHAHLLLLAAWSLGVSHQRGLPETFIATAGVLPTRTDGLGMSSRYVQKQGRRPRRANRGEKAIEGKLPERKIDLNIQSHIDRNTVLHSGPEFPLL